MKWHHKILIFLLMSLFLLTNANAQQLGYSQYFVNLPAENPGFTGIEDFLDFKLGSRQGWSDFSDANSSAFVSAYGMLNKPLQQMAKNNMLRISDLSALDNLKSNVKLRRKHGLGGLMRSNVLGPYKASEVNVNYAYHLPVSKKMTWSLGTKIGIDFEKVDFTNFTVRDEINDTFYQELINSNEGRRTSLITDFGSVLYSDDLYLAISTQNLVSNVISNNDLLDNTRLTKYQLMLGKMVDVSENVEFSLGSQLFYSKGFDINWTFNARMSYKNILYVGGAYENETRFSILGGLMSEGKFSVHYAYNSYLNDLSSFSVSSHEFIIGVFIFNKYALGAKLW